jgi:hypothetical protein
MKPLTLSSGIILVVGVVIFMIGILVQYSGGDGNYIMLTGITLEALALK